MKNLSWKSPALFVAAGLSAAIAGACVGPSFVTPGDTASGGAGGGTSSASTGGGGASSSSGGSSTNTGGSTTSSTGTGTGAENCFNGHDDNADGVADCDDPLCQDAVQCAPAGPDASWIGPGVVSFGGAGQTLGCKDGMWGSDELFTSGQLNVPDLGCQCLCDATVLCVPGSMVEYPNGCGNVPGPNLFKPDVPCTNDPNAGAVTGALASSVPNAIGGCKSSLKRTDTMVTFKEEARFCREPLASPCASGKTCVASPQGDQHLCIMKQGDVACPMATYPKKYVTHDGFQDGRDCTNCGCGQPQGVACGGTVELFEGPNCANAPFDTLLVNDDCKSLADGSVIASYKYKPAVTAGGCQPSSSTSQGTAIATLPRTFCCVQ